MTTIVALESKNVKRLKAVELHVDGSSLVIIGGRNAQGKTSVLDSIWYALAGKRALPPKPLRDGEEYGKTRLVLSDGLVVTRSYTEDGGGELKVENDKGMAFRAPQKMLDDLVGAMTFDPLAFGDLKAAERLELLAKLVGLDLSVLSGRRVKLYDERTLANRELKNLRGALSQLPAAIDGVPAEEVSVSALTTSLEGVDRGVNTLRETLTAEHAKRDSISRRIESAKKEIEADHQKIAELKRMIVIREESVIAMDEQVAECEAALPVIGEEISKIDGQVREALDRAAQLREQLNASDGINTQVRANLARMTKAGELQMKELQVTGLSERIEAIDVEKAKALGEAKFPIEGLAFGEDDVVVKGQPWEQASLAERIEVCVAMGFALNPELRVLLAREGSGLDDEHLALVAQLAEKADGQLWIERVGDRDEAAVVIEDGMVRGVEAPSADGPNAPAAGVPATTPPAESAPNGGEDDEEAGWNLDEPDCLGEDQ
jgi:hypothetical protein